MLENHAERESQVSGCPPFPELEALLKGGMRDDIQSAELNAARNGLKKLGLQLVQRKAPIEALVVDHLEKAPTEN